MHVTRIICELLVSMDPIIVDHDSTCILASDEMSQIWMAYGIKFKAYVGYFVACLRVVLGYHD